LNTVTWLLVFGQVAEKHGEALVRLIAEGIEARQSDGAVECAQPKDGKAGGAVSDDDGDPRGDAGGGNVGKRGPAFERVAGVSAVCAGVGGCLKRGEVVLGGGEHDDSDWAGEKHERGEDGATEQEGAEKHERIRASEVQHIVIGEVEQRCERAGSPDAGEALHAN